MENAFETSEEDLDKFLDKIKNEYKDGWNEENWENVSKALVFKFQNGLI